MLGTLTSPGTASGLQLRAAAGALALGVLIGGVSGCSSNPEPPPLESASAAPSATPTPSAVPPELPAEAKGASKAAAKAFVRHYIDLINYASSTGDVDPLAPLSAPACQSCEAIMSNVLAAYAHGGEIKGDGWTLLATRVIRADVRMAVLSLDVRLEPETLVTGDGRETHNQGGRQPMTIHLRHSGDTWAVTRLDLVS